MQYRDRAEAGELLGRRLENAEWTNPIVLALPRGGVPVAELVAEAIGGELGIVVTRKIGAPFNREMAIGSVDPDGNVTLDSRLVQMLEVDESYIRSEVAKQLLEISRRMKIYGEDEGIPAIEGRDTVLVDDGIATGYTMISAARYVRRHKPSRLIIATPVCPPNTFDELCEEVDSVVSLLIPARFIAVGQFYDDFSQVSDEEVQEIMVRARSRK